jgi:CrcB protein
MAEWQRWVWLAVLGAVGTLARYFLDGFVQMAVGNRFPWGILLVNSLGCGLFGVVWSLAEGRQLISHDARAVILTGFMGAFTTFSTFSFQTGQLMQQSHWGLAGANVAAQIVLGLAALFGGLALGRLF